MTIAHRVGENGLLRTKYKCDICGVIDFWQPGWSRYSSIAHDETCSSDVPHACPDHEQELLKKVKSGEFVLPKLQADGYHMSVIRERKGY